VPLPTPVSATPVVTARARRARRAGRPVLLLVLAAAVAGAATFVLGHDAALVALALSTVTLLAAGVLGLRAQWLTVTAEETATMTEEPAARPAPDPADELRTLRDQYVAAVNTALDEGDIPRARELADAYSDDALRVITR
jgi:hypothetical protein